MKQKNLLLQTHRLGDLIMSYPLCSWLTQNGTPIWLMGEEKFFKNLLRLSPKHVFYVPLEAQEQLLEQEFQQLINLSHSQEAALISNKIHAQHKIGALENEQEKKVLGLWQLYRTSLTHNNHYNKFHWAELNALDSIPIQTIQNTRYMKPKGVNKGRIGLFVGASEEAKRPDIEFWAELALNLATKGYQPVFLGGSSEEEKNIAQRAAQKAKMPRASLAGRFTLVELITFLQTLDLFITPDTGPMHLAAMQGIPTFNLSMGPVHPWETAPYQPHHYVLRSRISCSGCWQCTKTQQFCRKAFVPSRISALIHTILQKKTLPTLPELCLYKTGRTQEGLYQLESLFGAQEFRDIQGDFWRYMFADYIQNHNEDSLIYTHNNKHNNQIKDENESKGKIEIKKENILEQTLTFVQENTQEHIQKISQASHFKEKRQESARILLEKQPKIHALLIKKHIMFIKEIMLLSKKNARFSPNAWLEHEPFLRPLTSFIQLYLENNGYSKEGKNNILDLLEDFGKNLLV